jgi:hypothetical protein
MQFTMKLLSLLPLISLGLASPVDMEMDTEQQTIQFSCTAENSNPITEELASTAAYGYRGPGVYHITNDRGGKALSINTHVQNPPVGVWEPNHGPAQHWIIAAVAPGEYSIVSKVTGAAITVKAPGQQVHANQGTIQSTASHFYLDFTTWAGTARNPVAFKSVKNHGQVLDQSAAKPLVNGTPVISYNHNTPRSANQAWTLRYLH